jgi:hypothetical protein
LPPPPIALYSIEIDMNGVMITESGIKKLVESYKKAFRIPENLNFYSNEDFRKAERKFVKIAIRLRTDDFSRADRPEQSV